MSFDPRDYAGVSFDDEHGYTETRELAELQAQEDDEQRARELAFRETPFCELDCYEKCIHTAGCETANSPVTVAIGGWLHAVAPRMRAPRMAEIAPGIYFPVGNGKGRKRRVA